MLWDRIDLERDPEVVRRAQSRMALGRAGQADADQLCREPQRRDARRVSERDTVSQTGPHARDLIAA